MYGIIDCDNCYVSCERVFRPDLRDKPVVVLSNNDGCVVARSNEAKKMLHFNILKQLDETVWPTPKREAYLYSFNEESYNELKQKGFRLEF